MGSVTTLATNTSSNYSITNDEFDDDEAVNVNSLGSNLNLNSPSTSNSRIADLTELDSLLDDLYQAKQKLANAKNQNPIDVLNSANLNKNNPTSHPQKYLSADNNTTVTCSGSESASSSSYSPVSSLNQTQTRISQQLTNSRISVADAASKELESLMQNLSMYKKESSPSQESEIPIYFEKKEQYSNENDGETVVDLRNSCFSCKEKINGQVITALGYLWHPNHFVCFYCNKSIGTSVFYEKDNRPYCENDYLNLFSPKCASCTHPILDVNKIKKFSLI
jgi:paxillin